MPGLRGTPAVTMTISAPSISEYELVPLIVASKPSTAPLCIMSSDLPAGMPSATSNRTTSPSSFRPMRWARVPPIIPAPMSAILVRAMGSGSPLSQSLAVMFDVNLVGSACRVVQTARSVLRSHTARPVCWRHR